MMLVFRRIKQWSCSWLPASLLLLFVLSSGTSNASYAGDNSCKSIFAEFGLTDSVSRTSEIRALVGSKSINQEIESAIQNAEKFVVIQMSTFSNEKIIRTLENKASSGIPVIAIFSHPSGKNKTRRANSDQEHILNQLRKSGVETAYVPERALLIQTHVPKSENHRKVVLVDGNVGFLSTSNASEFDNFDLAIRLSGNLSRQTLPFLLDVTPHVSDRLRSLMNSDIQVPFESYMLIATHSKLKSEILKAIDEAEHRIDLVAYELSDPQILQSLISKRSKSPNLKINVLLGPSRKERTYFNFFDFSTPQNHDAFEKLSKAGIKVRFGGDHLTEMNSLVHAKAIVFDDHKIVLGSSDFNWKSLYGNLESNLIVDEPVAAQLIRKAIEVEVEKGATGYRARRFDRVSAFLFNSAVDLLSRLNSLRRFQDRITLQNQRYRILMRKLRGLFTNFVFGPKLEKKSRFLFLQSIDDTLISVQSVVESMSVRFTPLVDPETIKGSKHILISGLHTNRLSTLPSGEMILPGRAGHYGAGLYLTNSPLVARDYAVTRALNDPHGSQKQAFIGVFAVTSANLVPFSSELLRKVKAWSKIQSLSEGPLSSSQILSDYYHQNGIDGAYILDAEGPGHDYVVLSNTQKATLIGYIQFQL